MLIIFGTFYRCICMHFTFPTHSKVAYGKRLANMELTGEKVETFTSVSWMNLGTDNLLVPIFSSRWGSPVASSIWAQRLLGPNIESCQICLKFGTNFGTKVLNHKIYRFGHILRQPWTDLLTQDSMDSLNSKTESC